ncbi:MAG: glycosyl hydrolase-related protein, partial [Clostridiales bacterium]|nr:glycosyl hydrolase-related protein [Clostridiales bacterium]
GEDGELASVYDKEARRETLLAASNALNVYEDKPAQSHAWDIDIEYRNKKWRARLVGEPKLLHNSPQLAIARVVKRFNKSTVTQDIVLRRGSRRIDFETHVDWREREKLLKAEFSLDVLASRATYEIQFGAIERSSYRNTAQERAKFEVCAHKWADMSEGGYGVALLNNCKYGYDAVENMLRLTLLRAPIAPDPNADIGEHRFTYSLFPHIGGWQAGGVVNAGYELNVPLDGTVCREAAAVGGAAVGGVAEGGAAEGGAAYVDLTAASMLSANAANVIVDTVKAAEDGNGLIIRVYEATGSKTNGRLATGFELKGVAECNLMEENEAEMAHSGKAFEFCIKPFEIKTFRLLY